MFAVVEINDKQHLVQEGDILTIDGNISDKKASFDQVLMLQNGDDVDYGQPYLKNIKVEAEVIESGKREKDIVFKFKRKTGYKLTRGHRQNSTLLRISKISVGGTKAKTESKAKAETKTTTKKPTAKKTVSKKEGKE